jgi:hypothetical protein
MLLTERTHTMELFTTAEERCMLLERQDDEPETMVAILANTVQRLYGAHQLLERVLRECAADGDDVDDGDTGDTGYEVDDAAVASAVSAQSIIQAAGADLERLIVRLGDYADWAQVEKTLRGPEKAAYEKLIGLVETEFDRRRCVVSAAVCELAQRADAGRIIRAWRDTHTARAIRECQDGGEDRAAEFRARGRAHALRHAAEHDDAREQETDAGAQPMTVGSGNTEDDANG